MRRSVPWLILFALLLYVPFAGSYGLYDPWETHYGEVARQMNERGDSISLWWPGSPKENRGGEFWSKPVLSFWVMSLSMKAVGLGDPNRPDEMVSSHRPEWALRIPFILFGALAVSKTTSVGDFERTFSSARLSALFWATAHSSE